MTHYGDNDRYSYSDGYRDGQRRGYEDGMRKGTEEGRRATFAAIRIAVTDYPTLRLIAELEEAA